MNRPSFACLCLVLAMQPLAGCRDETALPARPCSSDEDCVAGSSCVEGRCAAGGADAGAPADAGNPDVDAGVVDAGTPDAGCAIPCGRACCDQGQVCDQDACRLDCGALERCGAPGSELCCPEGQVCYREACAVPGPACSGPGDCLPGELCDPALARCMVQGDPGCEYRPPVGAFNPGVSWHFTASGDSYTQVMMTPVVIDVNGDRTPDILANFFGPAGYNAAGVMRAISGLDGTLLWTSADVAEQHIHPPASIAAGDLDGSGRILAITVANGGALIAFDAASGALAWTSHDSAGAPYPCAANWGGPSLADLDGNGVAEVICGLMAFDAGGQLLWDHGLGLGAAGPLTVAADLDGDGKLEVTDGAQAFRADGSALGWTGSGFGGFPATGDFVDAAGALGRDGSPELVVVHRGQIALVSGASGAVLAGPAALPSWDGAACAPGVGNPGNGGPPTVADFDGDGQPEVGVADLDCYSVFELGSDAGALALQVAWSKKVQDHSSSVTGSSVFDFEGDGAAEVVYADEVLLHVFRGSDGQELFSRPHCSGTTYEYPLIVDVDGNGRADVVIAENTYAAGGLGCDPSIGPGIQVFRDAADNWVNTRRIWNQHTYHVTNVCDGRDLVCGGRGAAGNTYGRIPAAEQPGWAFSNAPADQQAAPLNNFRQNVQGESLFSAPDLAGEDLQADRAGCPSELRLSLRVVNNGALGILAGLKVAFYEEQVTRALIGIASTQGPLAPGQSEVVTLVWSATAEHLRAVKVVAIVDDDGAGASTVSECRETNNEFGPLETGCGSGPS